MPVCVFPTPGNSCFYGKTCSAFTACRYRRKRKRQAFFVLCAVTALSSKNGWDQWAHIVNDTTWYLYW